MANEIKRLEHLVDIASAIIETPKLSLKDFGIVKDLKTQLLTYTSSVSTAAVASYAVIASASVSFVGMTAIVGSLFPRFGIVGALYGWYRNRKRKQQEKDRMYREIIKKQQAAIARQRDINRELEQRLNSLQQNDAHLRENIDELRQKIANLTELIGVLTEQQENFKAA